MKTSQKIIRGTETMDKVLLVIPAYNEGKNIERVVDHIKNDFPELDYVVVNDGSKMIRPLACRQAGYNFIDAAGKFRIGWLLSDRYEICLAEEL